MKCLHYEHTKRFVWGRFVCNFDGCQSPNLCIKQVHYYKDYYLPLRDAVYFDRHVSTFPSNVPPACYAENVYLLFCLKNAIYSDDGCNTFLWSVSTHLPSYRMCHPRKQQSSSEPWTWQPQISGVLLNLVIYSIFITSFPFFNSDYEDLQEQPAERQV